MSSVSMHVPMFVIWSSHFREVNVMSLCFALVHVFLTITIDNMYNGGSRGGTLLVHRGH
jgi:hypothetical protein